jgi:hypothetical protein
LITLPLPEIICSVVQLDRLFGVDDLRFGALLRAFFGLAFPASGRIFAGQTNTYVFFRQVHDVADGRLHGEVAP